jgi:hypothetical protein
MWRNVVGHSITDGASIDRVGALGGLSSFSQFLSVGTWDRTTDTSMKPDPVSVIRETHVHQGRSFSPYKSEQRHRLAARSYRRRRKLIAALRNLPLAGWGSHWQKLITVDSIQYSKS